MIMGVSFRDGTTGKGKITREYALFISSPDGEPAAKLLT